MNKERGEQAEAVFLAKALSEGYIVCKPWGENQAYDFIVDYKGKLSKVQVKSCSFFRDTKDGGHYKLTLKRGGKKTSRPYTSVDLDIIAIFAENGFYVIPIDKIRGSSIKLYPHRVNIDGFYESYRESWEVFQ